MSRRQVTYEVYVQSSGRWMLHARFDGAQRDQALEEARQIDAQPNAGSVKVIREVYYPDTNLSEDSVIFLSSELKKEEDAKKAERMKNRPPAPAGGGGGGGVRGGGERPAGSGREALPEKPANASASAQRGPTAPAGGQTISVGFVGVIIRILIVLLLSVLGATGLSLGTSFVLSSLDISRGLGANLTFGAFVVGFIASAMLLMKKYLPINQLAFAGMGGGARPRRQPRRRARRRRASGPKPAAGRPEALPPVETSAADAVAQMKSKEDREEAEKKAREEAEKRAVEEAKGKKKKKKKNSEVPAEVAKHRTSVMDFIGESLKPVIKKRPSLDAYNKFGFNLFLAGACGVVADDNNLDADGARQMLQSCLESNGTKTHLARTFIDKYEDYLLDQKYLDMFNAGRTAMSKQADKDPTAARLLSNAMDKWNKPVSDSRTSAPITVMFTDLAGSTAMTQRLGDEKAQIVVRAHNTIVRSALQRFGGKEIKHTGDGIMAQFMTASGAVEGSIEIQRATAQHNKSNKELEFHICIGLHSGEAISEDDDLFGTTVQMSARTCSKAESDEILVTDIVRQLCSGRANLKFNEHGKWEMKGYSQPVPLFIVPWN